MITQTHRQVMDPDMNSSANESAAARQARHNLSIDLDLNPEDPKRMRRDLENDNPDNDEINFNHPIQPSDLVPVSRIRIMFHFCLRGI